MLLQYDRQLVTARRLARQLPGGEARPSGPPPAEAASPTPESKRRAMVEHVARELLDNLFFTGSDNPVVAEVRKELDAALGVHYSFWYPPGELDVRIMREDADGRRPVDSEERKRVMTALWDITLAKVDATML